MKRYLLSTLLAGVFLFVVWGYIHPQPNQAVEIKKEKNDDSSRSRSRSKKGYPSLSEENEKLLKKQGFSLVKHSNGRVDVTQPKKQTILGSIRGNQISCYQGRSAKDTNPLLQQATYLPNFTYKVEYFIYKTDTIGRVKEAKISAFSKAIKVNPGTYSHTKVIKIREGIKGLDDAGHLIARSLGGPSEMINYTPQNYKLNRGRWNALEKQVKAQRLYIKNYTITLLYKEKHLRPYQMIMEYDLRGMHNRHAFLNAPR